jgi:hypothetical protein
VGKSRGLIFNSRVPIPNATKDSGLSGRRAALFAARAARLLGGAKDTDDDLDRKIEEKFRSGKSFWFMLARHGNSIYETEVF